MVNMVIALTHVLTTTYNAYWIDVCDLTSKVDLQTTFGELLLNSDDNPREACGVVGVYGSRDDVARMTFFGLYALQHRGQESVGIATGDGEQIRVHTEMGLVSQTHQRDNSLNTTNYWYIRPTVICIYIT